MSKPSQKKRSQSSATRSNSKVTKPTAPSGIELTWNRLESKAKYASLILATLAALLVCYSVASANGFTGFPFDDAWIHLTFARTLALSGRFAYGPLNAATSGSTSPLFTFMESILFLVTKNEFAVALIHCVAAYAGAAFVFYLLVREYTALPWLPLVGLILFVTAPSILVVSNWGMETGLVIALLLWALIAYRREHWTLLATVLGLAIWVRPDSIVLAGAIGLDYLYTHRVAPSTPGIKAILIFIAIVSLYVGFNLLLSHTLLPNTFYAKLAYYKNSSTDFWSALWQLMAGSGKLIVFILAVAGTAWSLAKKRRGNLLLLLYPSGMVLLYRWKLPYLFQDGRYLIPILPFLLLLAVIGAVRTASWAVKSIPGSLLLSSALLVLAVGGEFSGMSDAIGQLTVEDAYIHNLQVTTAAWCQKNLPRNAVIATHDIGALGYYSGRRVIDIVGLADPDMIKFLDKPGAANALRKKGATYAALLDNWYEIPNENTVFVNAPSMSETMRVYHFTDTTRFTGSKVLSIHKYLYDVLRGEDPSSFPEAMREATADEPDNALTFTLGAEVLLKMNRPDDAKKGFQQALSLFPTSDRARNELALCFKD